LASQKQIAANRANAKRSTGPTSGLGKLRSSRNALKHGFSLGLPLSPANIKRIEALKKQLGGRNGDADLDLALEEFARAQLQILRIRKVQTHALAELRKGAESDELKALRRLASLDRYERYALTQRGRAARRLEQVK
jgi:hypothetical protein